MATSEGSWSSFHPQVTKLRDQISKAEILVKCKTEMAEALKAVEVE